MRVSLGEVLGRSGALGADCVRVQIAEQVRSRRVWLFGEADCTFLLLGCPLGFLEIGSGNLAVFAIAHPVVSGFIVVDYNMAVLPKSHSVLPVVGSHFGTRNGDVDCPIVFSVLDLIEMCIDGLLDGALLGRSSVHSIDSVIAIALGFRGCPQQPFGNDNVRNHLLPWRLVFHVEDVTGQGWVCGNGCIKKGKKHMVLIKYELLVIIMTLWQSPKFEW